MGLCWEQVMAPALKHQILRWFRHFLNKKLIELRTNILSKKKKKELRTNISYLKAYAIFINCCQHSLKVLWVWCHVFFMWNENVHVNKVFGCFTILMCHRWKIRCIELFIYFFAKQHHTPHKPHVEDFTLQLWMSNAETETRAPPLGLKSGPERSSGIEFIYKCTSNNIYNLKVV